MSVFSLPKIYPIVDASCFREPQGMFIFAETMVSGGCNLLQYRNKAGTSQQMLSEARELRRRVGRQVTLIMNDRADIALAADFDGVHVGQDDLWVEAVRKIVGPNMIVGASTHNPEQLRIADQTSANYLAIGPVFSTVSKANPDPVVGVAGVESARELTRKPLVAIGGLSLDNAHSVIQAGADSLALISALVPEPSQSLAQFQQLLM